jgi:prepilin peptidase CpaA
MNMPFFPGPVFAWTFCVVLFGLLGAAAYRDLRTMLVPKALTLTVLPLGLLFNVARGAWLGAKGLDVWTLQTTGPWWGAVDGLLFGLSGFFAGFGLFFMLWILGTCGGGDVKLFAALGAWIGPYLAVVVLTGTLLVVGVFVLLHVGSSVRRRGLFRTMDRSTKKGRSNTTRNTPSPRAQLLTYSLPLAVTTVGVLLWTMRVDLQLAPARPKSQNEAEAHAR